MFTLTLSNCKASLQTRHKSYPHRDPESVAQVAVRLKNTFSDPENSPDVSVLSEGAYSSRQSHRILKKRHDVAGRQEGQGSRQVYSLTKPAIQIQ